MQNILLTAALLCLLALTLFMLFRDNEPALDGVAESPVRDSHKAHSQNRNQPDEPLVGEDPHPIETVPFDNHQDREKSTPRLRVLVVEKETGKPVEAAEVVWSLMSVLGRGTMDIRNGHLGHPDPELMGQKTRTSKDGVALVPWTGPTSVTARRGSL